MIKQSMMLVCMLVTAAGCEAPTQITNFQVEGKHDVTVDDLEGGLSMQGIEIFPFEYHSLSQHSVQMTTRYFRDGVEVNDGSRSSGTLSLLEAGKQRLVLYVNAEDDHMKIKFKSKGGSIGIIENGIDLSGTARTYSILNTTLSSTQPNAVLVYCANQDSISGFNPDKSIESIVAEYEQVLAVYLQIK